MIEIFWVGGRWFDIPTEDAVGGMVLQDIQIILPHGSGNNYF